MLRAIGLLNLKQRCKPAESIPQTFELLNFYGKSPPPPLPPHRHPCKSFLRRDRNGSGEETVYVDRLEWRHFLTYCLWLPLGRDLSHVRMLPRDGNPTAQNEAL